MDVKSRQVFFQSTDMNVDAKRTISQDIARRARPRLNLRQHADNGSTMIAHGKRVFIFDKIDLAGHARKIGKKFLEKRHALADRPLWPRCAAQASYVVLS